MGLGELSLFDQRLGLSLTMISETLSHLTFYVVQVDAPHRSQPKHHILVIDLFCCEVLCSSTSVTSIGTTVATDSTDTASVTATASTSSSSTATSSTATTASTPTLPCGVTERASLRDASLGR